MTKKREALTLALEYLKLQKMYGPAMGFANTTIDEAIAKAEAALAQPDAFEQGRQEGMKQERALWELSKLGQEIEACQYAVDVAMPEYRCVGKCQYAAPPQRPWVELTGEEMESTCAGTWSYDPYVIARAIADKLKEKNTC